MKKLLIALLTVAMLLAFAACGNSTGDNTASDTATAPADTPILGDWVVTGIINDDAVLFFADEEELASMVGQMKLTFNTDYTSTAYYANEPTYSTWSEASDESIPEGYTNAYLITENEEEYTLYYNATENTAALYSDASGTGFYLEKE